tara:strand:+ start:223 stop:336 length:114 start_codon:yes stop_codon:yes gene_type:complete
MTTIVKASEQAKVVAPVEQAMGPVENLAKGDYKKSQH